MVEMEVELEVVVVGKVEVVEVKIEVVAESKVVEVELVVEKKDNKIDSYHFKDNCNIFFNIQTSMMFIMLNTYHICHDP